MSNAQITSTLREVSSLLFDAHFAETNRRRMSLITRANRLYSKAIKALNAKLEASDDCECLGHPAGPFDPMGQTVYCDGSCRVVAA